MAIDAGRDRLDDAARDVGVARQLQHRVAVLVGERRHRVAVLMFGHVVSLELCGEDWEAVLDVEVGLVVVHVDACGERRGKEDDRG
eukprot:220737-Chlamydomonas_euryale.AAC.2